MDSNYRYLKEKESAEEIKNKDRSKSIKLNEAKVDNKNKKKVFNSFIIKIFLE